jgi:hypothetical protein
LATTAPVAMGLLTDLVSEFVVYRGEDGRDTLWPLIKEQYVLWCVGRQQKIWQDSMGENSEAKQAALSWFPCEALVRIAARDIYRLAQRLFADSGFKDICKSDQLSWSSLVLGLLSDVLSVNSQIEDAARGNLLELKHKQSTIDRKQLDLDFDDLTSDDATVDTPFGKGRVTSVNKVSYVGQPGSGASRMCLTVQVVDLEFGGILYQPVIEGSTSGKGELVSDPIPLEVTGTL